MQVQVTAELSPALRRLLAVKDADVQAAVIRAVNRTIIQARTAIAESTPVGNYTVFAGRAARGRDVKTGSRLRNSIRQKLATKADPVGIVFTNVYYAPFVEYGTGIHSEAPGGVKHGPGGGRIFIRAKNAKALRWRGPNGQWFFAKWVFNPGMRPAAMFRSNIPDMQASFRRNLADELDKLFKAKENPQ